MRPSLVAPLLPVLLFGVRPVAAAPTALVLSDPALPGQSAPLVQSVADDLRRAGYAPETLSVADTLRPDALQPGRCALLVLPRARALPRTLAAPLNRYLQAGGHLLALGAPLWGTLLVQDGSGRWVTPAQQAQARALLPPPHPLFDFAPGPAPAAWTRTTNRPESPTQTDVVSVTANGRTAPALHTVIGGLNGYDTFNSPPLTQPVPAGDTLTVFSARGDARTKSLAVEWDERDGSRWIATVPLTPRWQGYRLAPAAFRPWLVPEPRAREGFHPENAVRMSVGLAYSHTGETPGRHEYWVAALGTAPATAADAAPQGQGDLPRLDTLAPADKFFDIHGPAQLAVSPVQATVPALTLPQTALPLASPQPRPGGTGFDKRRGWRQVPLLTATDPRSGQWRGTPGTLRLWAPGASFQGGVWASFSVDDPAFYQSPAGRQVLQQTAQRMRDGLFLIEGGAQYYTLFPGQTVRLGAAVADLAPVSEDAARQGTVRLRVTTPAGQTAWQRTWPVQVERGGSTTREAAWTPPARWPAGGYTVTTELLEGGRVVDRVRHGLSVWTPPVHPSFVAIRPDGHFYLDGKLWRANGVNYMPSSGVGVDDDAFFEDWLSGPAYDPDIIERDLSHIHDIGLNAVSVFQYAGSVSSQNLLDLLRRCREHGLRVNLSLRPGLRGYLDQGPAEANRLAWDNFRRIVDAFRLPENDAVFAYETDWEPMFGDHDARRRMDPDWRAWVQARRGSIPRAEAAWGVEGPHDNQGNLTNPSDAQMGSPGGPDTKMVADYRRFLDDWLARTYGEATRRPHARDPRHPVSFRMTEAGDPTNDQRGDLPYQFEGLSRAVDFLSPEGYGRIGDEERVRPGRFEIAYGRAVAPHEPILWAEMGTSVWDRGAWADDPSQLAFAGRLYADFYAMSRAAGADGIFWWWYPGGHRVNEDSDFGLINPDGTDRPATAAIRRLGRAFLTDPPPPAPDVWLTFDRAQHPDGIAGIYGDLAPTFWAAIAHGHHPGLRPR